MAADLTVDLRHPPDEAELRGIAEQLEVPLADVVLGNPYHDALEVALGCTAFAVEARTGWSWLAGTASPRT